MAARADPEDVLSDNYEDLEVQHEVILNRYRSDLSGGNTQFEPLHSFEPLNGLARDEVAELVAIYITQDSRPSFTQGSENTLQEEWELSFDSDAHLQQEDTDETEDFEGLTGFDLNVLNLLDIDVLWQNYRTFQAQILSGSDSAGAGGAKSSRTADYIPYRAWFGQGPITDRHDELFVHFRIQNQAFDAFGRTETRMTLWWDVFDAPTR